MKTGRAWFVLTFAFCLAASVPALAQTASHPLSLSSLAASTGDFDAIKSRRYFRLIVAYSKTLFFIDRGRQMGSTAEIGRAFEDWVNRKTGGHQFHVVFVPTPRDQLFTALREGRGDAIAANLTVTPERAQLVDFTTPIVTGVKEIVITGPSSPDLAALDDLAGKEIHVRKSSSYATHLAELNAAFRTRRLAEVKIIDLPDELEDEDAMEMVAAGILPLTIVDKHKADVWVGVYPSLKARSDLAINEGGVIAWALRKNSPKLAAGLNAFIAEHGWGTSFGNTVYRRYFCGSKAARPVTSKEAIARFEALIQTFRNAGDMAGFDWQMLAAQGYQESGLDQSKRSGRGAVGVMQLLPSTAASLGVTGIEKDETVNIRAGSIYMKLLMDRYVNGPGPDMNNRILMTFAAYNAGPGNLRRFRASTSAAGGDPNLWFGNVEAAAAPRRPRNGSVCQQHLQIFSRLSHELSAEG